jgi:hypothetical protein
MATTTNFGWETPDDTDLVKDGAAAMRTLGNSIDTSFVDLKGGTTNQVLAKNSNTDLDFKWVADATGISATIFDAKGDIIAATAADTADRLAVGTNGQVLTADSTTATGLKWASAGYTPKGYTLLNSPSGTTLSGAATITYSGISDQASLLIRVQGASSANASSNISLRFNSDSGANYDAGFFTFSNTAITYNNASGSTSIDLAGMSNNAGSVIGASVWIDGTNTTNFKAFNAQGQSSTGGGTGQVGYVHGGIYKGTSAITSVSVISDSGNFDAGTLFVYGKAI